MALAGAAAGATGLGLQAGRAFAQANAAADLIFEGGTIIPLASAGAGAVEALAVRGGQIVAVGAQSDIDGLKGDGTKVIDLGGRTLLPGFIDPHQHSCFVALFAELLADVGYTTYPTRAELIAGLKALDAKLPQGAWLAAYNFDNLLQGGDLSMAELDGVSKDRPILVWYINMHDGAANSAAFKIADIPSNVGVLPGGGHFGRGSDGSFNGLIYEESAMLKFVPHALPPVTPQIFAKAMQDFFKTAASYGYTTTHEPGTVQPAWIEGLTKLTASGTSRLSASLQYADMAAADAYQDLGRGAKPSFFPNSRFSLYGIKIIGDGSNQTLTGAQTIPYLNTSEKGATNYPADELKTMVAAVKAAGWPVQIHCNGDATIDDALNAIEAAYGANPATGINRIEHSTMARPDQLKRMKALGVQPSFLMNHVFFYGAAYRDQLFGPERTAFMDPAGACLGEDIPFTLHTDAPVLAARRAPPRPDGGDEGLRHRQVGHRPRPGDFRRGGAPRHHLGRRRADRPGRSPRLAGNGQGGGLRDPRRGPLQGRAGRDHEHQDLGDLGRRREDLRVAVRLLHRACRSPQGRRARCRGRR